MKGLDYSRPLSLYIHVPFCTRKCDYCAFYSVPYSKVPEKWIDRYVDIIIAEIDALNRDYGKAYYTVYIGGGNPAMIGWENIRRIVEKASENGRAEEVTVEMNPENVSVSILSLSDIVTRVSVGIQSMDENVLGMLGRNAKREDNIRALSLLSSSPFRWNADIITAVPGESVETTLMDIEAVASYNPGHISFYCLTFEENTPLIARAKPIGEEEETAFLSSGWAKLKELGYEHYEVSAFAREGERSKHNMVYWNLGQYVGFGAGAEGSIGWQRVTTLRDSETVDAFVAAPEMKCTPLTATETEEEFLLVALRTKDGIDKKLYENRFGHSFDSLYSEAIKRVSKDSYVDSPDCFRVTEEGFMSLDWIILQLAMGL